MDEQVGQTGLLGAMLLELQLGIDRTDAGEQHEQQHGAQCGNSDGNGFDHLYCLTWSLVFSRNGVERAG